MRLQIRVTADAIASAGKNRTTPLPLGVATDVSGDRVVVDNPKRGLINARLMSYEPHVFVHDGRQRITIAHGQSFDLEGEKITFEDPAIAAPPPEPLASSAAPAAPVPDSVRVELERPRTTRRTQE